MKILEIISDILNKVVDPTGRTQRQFKVIYRWAQNFFNGTFVACTGFGKALKNDEIVLTQDGWKEIQNLALNDKVYGSDGKQKSILGIYPQGKREIYKVSFEDGTSVNCDKEHLWEVSYKGHPEQGLRVLSVNDLLNHKIKSSQLDKRYNTIQEQLYYRVRLPKAIEYSKKELPIDPYTLGVLLGDGGLSRDVPTITLNHDFDITKLKIPDNVSMNQMVIKDNCTTWSFAATVADRNPNGSKTKNALTISLNDLGLMGKLSIDKFIPDIYTKSSISDRKAILQGLLDTDGYKINDHLNEYSTSSKRLALDVVELIRGLGIYVIITLRTPKFTYKGETKTGHLNFRLYLNLNKTFKSIESIKYLTKSNATCIKIDSEDELFITNGFTLTHNTRVGMEAIKLLRRTDPSRKVIVVVPKIPLQAQWRKLLIENKQDRNTEVWVINSLVNEASVQDCSLLVLDEIHRYAAETFSKVFNVVRYKYIIGLTATIERSDGKHILLEKYAPVIDEVPLHVARAKGWVAKYKSYNYGISLPPDEQQEYDVIYGKKSNLMKYMAPFNYDLQTIIQCSVGNKPRYDPVSRRLYAPKPVRIARLMGWVGNNVSRASQLVAQNKTAPRGSKVNIWGGNKDHIYHPDRIVGYAVQARRLIAERKKFICNHYLKTEAVIELYHALNRKTISFTETKEVAKKIQELIGEKAVSYYSQMDSITTMVTKTKTYKRRNSVDKYVEKHPETSFDIKEENNNFIITWQQEKFVGEAFQKREALRKLTDNRYKINFISSVRALNEGIDFPDLELALIHSRNSTPRDTIQRKGRVARLFIYKDGSNKEPIIVNIYLKFTKDEDWLRKASVGSVGDIWVDSISQIIDDTQFAMIA